MNISPFEAGKIGGKAVMRSKRARDNKVFNKTMKDIDSAYENGASSKEDKRFSSTYGGSMTAMDEAKANIANRRRKAAGTDIFGELKTGATAKTFAEVSGENRDMRTPEQKAKDIAAASAGRSNADIAASQPSATSRVMQQDEPQSAFGQANRSGSLSSRQASSAGKSGNLQANRTGSLSSRSTRQVGRGYYSDERAGERANRRNEEASRRAYGF